MDREGGNKEKMRKCREWISLHFLILSPVPLHSFPLHFLILSPFSRIPDARMQQVVQPCHPLFTILFNSVQHESNLVLRKMHQLSVDIGHIHPTHRLITLSYSRSVILLQYYLYNPVQHESNLVFRKMHQLSVDGAMGGPGVVDYRKGCLIILTTIVLRDVPCISSKAVSLPKCDHSYTVWSS